MTLATTNAALTVPEAASVAQALTDTETLTRFVRQLPAEQVPVYLARLLDAATNIRTLVTGLEQRLMNDEQVGKHFEVDGVEYGVFGAQRKGYENFPGLVRFLIEDCGMPVLDIAAAVSDARVTDLRQAANEIRDLDKRQAALDEIEAHRVDKGARGVPKFQLINERFISKPATSLPQGGK